MIRVFRKMLSVLAVFLGGAVLVGGCFVVPYTVYELLHPTGSFAGPINRAIWAVLSGSLAISAAVEAALLGFLIGLRWTRHPAVIVAASGFGAIALGSLVLHWLLTKS